jgi:polyferredoxin
MLFVLVTRDRLDVNVLPDRNPRYVVLSDGQVRNGYTIKILNMELEEKRVLLQIAGIEGALMTVAGQDLWPSRTREFLLEADKVRQLKVFVAAPRENLAPGDNPFRFSVTDLTGIEQAHYGANLYAPEN